MNGGEELQLQVGDLFQEEDDAVMAAVNEREIWLQNNNNGQDEHTDLLASVMDDASLFYADDDFPSLPDFSCMSSSSSSSSTPATVKTITCGSSSNTSSSSATSWPNLKSDAEDHAHVSPPPPSPPPPPPLSSTASMEVSQPPDQGGVDGGDYCIDMMDTFGYMELMESNDFFDRSSIFETEENLLEEFARLEQSPPVPQEEEHAKGMEVRQQQEPPPLIESPAMDEEMSSVFLEWLKTNKDSVSATDLRNVRLKKATIESAAKRLGGGKEATKQLLKLILEWVQTSHLQNKRRKENHTDSNNNNDNNSNNNPLMTQFQDATNPSSNLNHQTSLGPEWISPPPYGADQAALAAAPAPFPQPMLGYNVAVNPFSNGVSSEFHMLESTHSWPPSPFTVYNNQPFGDSNLHPAATAAFAGYGTQYPYQFFQGSGTDRGMRLGPLATKEARKKRMARQRRYLSHHRHHNHHEQQIQQNQTGDYCAAATVTAHANLDNWLYWQPMVTAGGGVASVAPLVRAEPLLGLQVEDRTAMQTHQSYQQQSRVSSDRRPVGSLIHHNFRV